MECNGCILCCKYFHVEVMKKAVGEMCTFCEDWGCTIHEDKPQECREFNCAYVQSEHTSIHMRPDKCGIIFERISDRIFLGTWSWELPYTQEGFYQVIDFTRQGFSVVLKNIQQRRYKFFIANIHNGDDIKKEFSELLEKHKRWQATEQI